MSSANFALNFAQRLVRCPSVTPLDAGVLDVLQHELAGLGFACHRLPFGEVDNLYARLGDSSPHLCFAGHVDVVPVGDATRWTVDPFAATVRDGRLYGRGAADMKGAVAAFVAAVCDRLTVAPLQGSVSFLITGDEEGPAVNGTVRVLDWMRQHGEQPDVCLVGEPTNPTELGQMVKVGRRGSLNAVLTVQGQQGHVAYPERARNPIPILLRILQAITVAPLDQGMDHFQPSNLEITSVDVGNPVTNVIPATAMARLNIRFNPLHSGEKLTQWLHDKCQQVTDGYQLEVSVSGEAFYTPPGPFTDLVVQSIQTVTGRTPELSTSGGTSDARFIRHLCPVIEFGGVGATMHQIDENMAVHDLEQLTAIYRQVLDRFFA